MPKGGSEQLVQSKLKSVMGVPQGAMFGSVAWLPENCTDVANAVYVNL